MASESRTIAELVTGYLAEQCTVILDAPDRLRAGDDVVHPTRVAVRRLRSTVRVFADTVDVPRAAHLDEELAWLAGLLGEVRDLDVLGQRLEQLLAELPPELVLGSVSATIATELAGRRHRHLATLLAALDTDRLAALLTELHTWRRTAPLTPQAELPAAKVGAYVKRAGRKVDRRLEAAVVAVEADDPEAGLLLHRARKAAKRHRYAAELALPVWGARADRVISSRRQLQDVLGDHQDSLVSAAFLRSLAARVGVEPGHNGFTYGLLYAREADSARRVVERLSSYR